MNEYVNKTINYTLGVNWHIEKRNLFRGRKAK